MFKNKNKFFVVFLSSFFLLLAGAVSAAVTVTPATGGSAVSADTNTTNGTATWTTLTGPTINETTGRAITPGSGTIILTAPTGFVFDTSVSVLATITRDAGAGTCFQFSSNSVIPTASTITYTLTARDSNASTRCHVDFSNIKIRPTAGTPLAVGNLTNTGSNTSVPRGAGNNYGTLTEVAGAKNKLAFTTQPSATVTINTDFSTKPVIRVQDQYGNTVTTDNSSTITRTAVLSTQACGGTAGSGVLSSTPANGATVSAGVLTYTAMQYSVGELIKICATSAGVTSALSNAITVNNPTPTTTSINPTSKTAGDAEFTLTVNGTNFISSSVVNFAGSPRTTTFVNSGQITAIIPASDLITDGVFNITVSNPTPGGGNSNAQIFTVNPVPTYQFALNNPSDIAAGNRAAYTVTRQDNLGAAVTSGSNTIYLYSNSAGANKKFYDAASGGNVISSVTISNGNASADFWYYDETPGDYTITASDNSVAPDGTSGLDDATDALTVTAGPVSQFILSNPGNATVGDRSAYTVTRQDQFGNQVTIGSTNVYLYSSSVSGTKKFYDAASGGSIISLVTIGNGNASTDFWYYDETPGTYTITASDNSAAPDGASGVADATDSLLINTGSSAVYILNDVTDLTVGNRAAYTVTRQDQFGNPATGGAETIYLYSSSVGANKKFFDAASGGNIVSSVIIGNGNGSADFWYYDEAPGTYTITASDNSAAPDGASGVADATDTLLVSAGVATQLTVDNPGNMTAGTRLGYTITRRDQFGNALTVGTTNVYLYTTGLNGQQKFYNAATDGNQIVSVTITDGNATAAVWYYDELAGSVTLTFSDNASAPDGSAGLTDALDAVTVNPAATAKFLLNDPGNMTAGTRLGYTVSRQDAFGNAVNTADDSVYLYSNSAGPSSFYDAVSGGNLISSITIGNGNTNAVFWYYDEAVGNSMISASDNSAAPDGASGIADAEDWITVEAAPIVATRLVILDPSDGTVDAPISVTVQAQDDSGNIDTSYQTDVTLLASGSATGAGLVNIINGVGTVNIADTVAQTVNLTLSDTQLTGLNITSSQNVVFAPGATAKFILNNPGDLIAGNRLGYAVSRQDQYGNNVIAGTDAVYLYSDSSATAYAFYDEASGGNQLGSLNIAPGQSQALFWYYDDKVGTWTIAVSDHATQADGLAGIDDDSDSLTVSAAATARFILSNPGDMTANTRLGYTVSRVDAFGNAVSAGTVNVYLYSNSSGSYDFYGAASGGTAINLVTINSNATEADFWYYDTAPGTWTISVSDNSAAPDGTSGLLDATDSVTVSAEPIVATRFVILPPGSALVNNDVTVTIQAQDDLGNIATDYQNDISLVTDGSATGGGLVNIVNGVGTKVITDAVAELVNLSLADTQNTGLLFSSTASLLFMAINSGGAINSNNPNVILPVEIPPVTTFVLSGKIYPKAVVLITEKSPQGGQVVKKTVTASDNGSFKAELGSDVAEARVYGVTVKDEAGRLSQTKIFKADFTKVDEIVRTIFMAPTIDLTRAVVAKGDNLKIIGYGNPNTRVRVQIDNGLAYETKTGVDGAYQLLLNTARLSLGTHVLQARQQDPVSKKYSDPSLSRNFLVSDLPTPKADLNEDGKIDAQDLSIFNSLYKKKDLVADLNDDGKVDLTDLSIFLKAIK